MSFQRLAFVALILWTAQSTPAQAHHLSVANIVPRWNVFLWIALGLLVAFDAVVVWAAYRSHDARKIERLWMMMPLSVLLVLGIVRVAPVFRAPSAVTTAGADALSVDVLGRQWEWRFEIPEKKVRSLAEVHVPLGRTVTLKLHSADVLHSFDVPALGLHQDLMPPNTTTIAFRAPAAGRYPIYCTALCGTDAQEMTGVIAVDPPDQYNAWVAHQQAQASTAPLAHVTAARSTSDDERRSPEQVQVP